MIKLIIPETDDNPNVILDKENNKFEFKGISMFENAGDFYYPIISWINLYIQNPNPDTQVEFKMHYCNSSSSKQIYEIIKQLVSLKDKNVNLSIRWHYDFYDDDMKDLGIALGKSAMFDLELVSYVSEA